MAYVFHINTQAHIYHKPLKEIEYEVQQKLNYNPMDIESLLLMEQILYRYHLDNISALKIIRKILVIQKDCIDARLDIIQIIIDFKFGSYQDCFQLIEECIEIDPDYWRIFFTKIRILDNMGNNDEKIIQEVNRCIKKYPNNKYFTIYNSQILAEQQSDNINLLEQELETYRKSQDLDFDLLRRISYSYENLKKGETAIEYVDKSIKLNPNSFISYNELAYLERIINGNNEKCLEYCLKSIQLNPRYSYTLNNLAATYKNLNRQEECIKCLKQTLELKSSPFTYHQLIYDYYDIKQLENAKYFSHKNVQKFSQDPYSNYLLQKINRKVFSIVIKDKEQQELQSIKCLNFNKISLRQDEYQHLSNTINEVYEDNQ